MMTNTSTQLFSFEFYPPKSDEGATNSGGENVGLHSFLLRKNQPNPTLKF
jgi:hypothetical protein